MTCDLKVYARNLESSAQEQIDTLAAFEAFDGCKVRIMPDAHAGAGCVIGFTANLGDKVVPNLVGVDIGCGMYAAAIDDVEDWVGFDRGVRKAVPAGFKTHGEDTCDVTQLGLLCEGDLRGVGHLNKSMGTLGGGNHFVEADRAEDGTLWLVVHSGSRNLGKQVADIYQRKARETCKVDTPKGLEFLTGELADAYLHDMRICQEWAKRNREAMVWQMFCKGLFRSFGHDFHTVHNYIGDDNMVRKGAISAKVGERVLIPFNMRDGAIIGVGLGNSDWNNSAPHGAGRTMSRKKARESLDMVEFQEKMEGVYSSSVRAATIDEAPMAYKPTQEIIDALAPTVEIRSRLMPAYNFKAVEQRGRR